MNPLYQTDSPKTNRLLHKWAIILFFIFFLCISVWYAIVIPAGEAVDEIPHFQYIVYVKENHKLPVQPETIADGVDVWMGHHPPLYYVLGAVIISSIDTSNIQDVFQGNSHFVWRENDGSNGWNVFQHFGQDDQPWQGAAFALHFMRFANIGISLAGLYALLRAGQLIFGVTSWLPIGIVGLIAFNVSFIFMTTSVHHDVLQNMIFSFGIWWIASLIHRKSVPNSYYILGGILVAGAMLTKLSGVVLGIVMVIAILAKAYRNNTLRESFSACIYTAGTTTLLAGWWYLRNYLLYNDPLGWKMFLIIHQHMIRVGSYSIDIFLNEFLGQISRTFWGAFGYMHITFPEQARYFWGITGIALFGFCIAIFRGRLDLKRKWPIWLPLLSLTILLFVSFIRFSIATTGAGHARYLFPTYFIFSAVIIIGINELTGWRIQAVISFLIIGLMAWYAIWLPSQFLLPKYAPPQTITHDALPNSVEQINANLGAGITLVAFEMDKKTNRLIPNEYIPFKLYWYSNTTVRDVLDTRYLLTLANQDEIISTYSDWPVPSLSPSNWHSNTLYVSDAVLHVPSQHIPDQASVHISLNPDREQTEVKSSITLIDDFISTGGIVAVSQNVFPNPHTEVFDNQLRLLGFNIPNGAISDTVLPIEIFWEAISQPQADYTAFIHILDEDNQLVTQYDRPVGGDDFRTSRWQQNDVFSDVYPIYLPSDMPSGKYNVVIGLYSWPSMERLRLTNELLEHKDSVFLTSIEIENTE